MARIRAIKPEFWTDEKVVQLPLAARLVFIGLWNLADDEGYLWFEPVRIKMLLMPMDDVDMASILDELVSCGLMSSHETSVNGKKCLRVNNFLRHQHIQHPSKSKISHCVLSENSLTPQPGIGIGIGTNIVCVNAHAGGEMRGEPEIDPSFDALPEKPPPPVTQAFLKAYTKINPDFKPTLLSLGQIKRLVKAHGEAVAIEGLDGFKADTYAQKAGYPLGLFIKQISSYVMKAKAGESWT